MLNFNPRSPHGERRSPTVYAMKRIAFQSTLPARGATLRWWGRDGRRGGFQSTLPARGATQHQQNNATVDRYFNPRSPHGERRISGVKIANKRRDFNPRSPHGERPQAHPLRRKPESISIHAPRTGSDVDTFNVLQPQISISIHAPRTGSDRMAPLKAALVQGISIHAPRTGSDLVEHDS